MFTATPGSLPADGTPVLADVSLPPGRRIAPEESPDTPVAWISSAVLPADEITALVRALIAAFPITGVWPMHAQGLGHTADDLDRPWFDGEFDGPDDRTFTAQQVLDGSFRGDLYDALDEDDEFEPELRFTVLADAVDGPDADPAEIGFDEPGALLLVPADRPANTVRELGWYGPANHDLVGEPVSAVLRSWEDRFGALPIAIAFDTLTLFVPRPPRRSEEGANDGGANDDRLRLLAAEHYAFCPDNIDQGLAADDYIEGLNTWTHWAFWWD
ncbi:MAG: DUF4253 domain-containing protein [Gordonia sp. (in: high G+C Gram-positive bacteria)]|uniref:DUF4253 domain-containing protein n=1 Tax=Gordonia sp. (in: high G+C Gram-positive bacteria) TaxID=84139 RepID=UPI0039E62B75